ncbi:MAG: YopX family protein [bacterium]
MQREIEFRAFDKETGKMHYLINKPYDEKTVDDELIVQIDSTGATGYTKNKYIGNCLMQSTGLLDKNGKKIFEGDILKIYYQNNQKSYLKKVKWLNDISNKGRWDALDNCAYTSCEVVGNIFENPELLAEINNN